MHTLPIKVMFRVMFKVMFKMMVDVTKEATDTVALAYRFRLSGFAKFWISFETDSLVLSFFLLTTTVNIISVLSIPFAPPSSNSI